MTPVQLALTGLELRDQGIASLERHKVGLMEAAR